MYRVVVLPQNQSIQAAAGETLLQILRSAGFPVSAPCGGRGSCGKCKVLVDGRQVLACQTVVDRDMTVTLPEHGPGVILTDGLADPIPQTGGVTLALDIGTTTVVAYLMDNGAVLGVESRKNPQASFGADVVSRINCAINGQAQALTDQIRNCVEEMTKALLEKTGKTGLDRVCMVANPAMQQLFLGIPVDNLAAIPFTPRIQQARVEDAGSVVSVWEGAELFTVPDIAGYVGADTVACVLATGMDRAEELTLLVDIGTNGEMVLGNRERMVACATAAGPALEGAGIQFGMQAAQGAIDRVEKDFSCRVIGGGKAKGICGSGLLDAMAAALDAGLINDRGRILNDQHRLSLIDDICLTQEDVRQLQLAKGAIAAGIQMMTEHLGICLEQIGKVFLAGAFGTFLDPRSACRIGLLPPQLEGKIQSVGNAAGSGAKRMVCSEAEFYRSEAVVKLTEHLELAALPEWMMCFAENMYFDSSEEYWCKRALGMGFTHAAPVDTATLTARQDVRDMCAEDKCGAYGKNWTCPPHCGDVEQCQQQMAGYHRGILVQTVGYLEKQIDSKGYRQTEQRHLQQFYHLAEEMKSQYPDALCLGSGGCRICDRCAWPEPCRFPEKACGSMEGYGLFVTQVCRDHDMQYYHGEKTVTYTACILF